MIWKLKALGFGNSSRQGAKSPSLEGKDEKVLPMILTRNLRPLRPLRPFVYAQDMLCGRYSEIWLRLCRAGKVAVLLRIALAMQRSDALDLFPVGALAHTRD